MATGEIATDPAAAREAAEAGRSVILVRAETSPDDVHGMEKAAGILTSRGGLASHAAVVARGWGIPAVVGATGVEVRAGRVGFGDRILGDGETITIDGSTGEVFLGSIPATTEIVPEATVLLGWARKLGIPIGKIATVAEPAGSSAVGWRITPDDALRVIAIKGFAQLAALADAVLSTADAVHPVVDDLVLDGLAANVAGAYRLTESGTARAAELLSSDQDRWGTEAATAALDAFLALDHRVKETVTAWQLRDGPSGQVPNDHADADYDGSVLERLGALHADAMAWLLPLKAGWPRIAYYEKRLDQAAAAATAGDGRFVASPRVDSYHGIWFELHEELIRLAGRTREDETAAGRA
jgi:pyruvate,orthophosphate dikinase